MISGRSFVGCACRDLRCGSFWLLITILALVNDLQHYNLSFGIPKKSLFTGTLAVGDPAWLAVRLVRQKKLLFLCCVAAVRLLVLVPPERRFDIV